PGRRATSGSRNLVGAGLAGPPPLANRSRRVTASQPSSSSQGTSRLGSRASSRRRLAMSRASREARARQARRTLSAALNDLQESVFEALSPGAGEEAVDGVERHDVPLPEDEHAVTEALDVAEEVGADDERPALGAKLLQDGPQLALAARVEAYHRLVQE